MLPGSPENRKDQLHVAPVRFEAESVTRPWRFAHTLNGRASGIGTARKRNVKNIRRPVCESPTVQRIGQSDQPGGGGVSETTTHGGCAGARLKARAALGGTPRGEGRLNTERKTNLGQRSGARGVVVSSDPGGSGVRPGTPGGGRAVRSRRSEDVAEAGRRNGTAGDPGGVLGSHGATSLHADESCEKLKRRPALSNVGRFSVFRDESPTRSHARG